MELRQDRGIKHICGVGCDKFRSQFLLKFLNFLGLHLLDNLPILVYLLKSYRVLLDSFSASLSPALFDINNLSVGELSLNLLSVSLFSEHSMHVCNLPFLLNPPVKLCYRQTE